MVQPSYSTKRQSKHLLICNLSENKHNSVFGGGGMTKTPCPPMGWIRLITSLCYRGEACMALEQDQQLTCALIFFLHFIQSIPSLSLLLSSFCNTQYILYHVMFPEHTVTCLKGQFPQKWKLSWFSSSPVVADLYTFFCSGDHRGRCFE